MVVWRTSRDVGWSTWSNPNWSGFMNAYAIHRFNTGGNANGLSDSGSTSFTCAVSGTYTIRAAVDNSGSACLNGSCVSASGFESGGNTTSRYYSRFDTISISWSFSNAPGNEDFNKNPCAIAWTVEGPAIPPPPTVSLSASPTSVIRGQGVNLTYSASGQLLTNAGLTDVANPGFGTSTVTVYPQNSKTYTYTVCNEAACRDASVFVTVYIPPTVSISFSSNPIIAGQNSTVTWPYSGDASSVTWTSGDITNTNLSGSANVSPSETTTYCAYVSGLGGTSPTSCGTLTVYQIPVIEKFEVMSQVDYGDNNITFVYESKYANTLHRVQIYARYTEGPNTGTTLVDTINLPLAASSEAGQPNITRSGQYPWVVPTWDGFGPVAFDFLYTIGGDGGQVSSPTLTTAVNIDRTPDNIIVDETDDLIKGVDPVYTPTNPDGTPVEVLGDLMLVDEVDVNVEIKADYPIQVQVNREGPWENVRQL